MITDTIDIEEGTAFLQLAASRPRMREAAPERFDVVVVGGGQAGLSAGYHLARLGLKFVILDASARIGDAWRNRWDSLRLFTAARYDGLDGMPFPGSRFSFPSKDQMADYLEAYADHFKLPVRSGIRVDRLARRGDRYVINAGDLRFEADQVIVAMSSYQEPWVPPFARELDPRIAQLHSSEYRNPDQLRPGPVLLVGAATSGAEIGFEVARSHKVFLSGRDTGEVPFNMNTFLGRHLFAPLMLRFVFKHVLTMRTPLGRRARPYFVSRGGPLIRVKSKDLAAAGVERVPRVAGVRLGRPLLDDGRALDVANVIWCTGYRPGYSWIDLPVLGEDGEPAHDRGVVPNEPGLYFLGLHYVYAPSSTMVHGVGRDARYIARQIAKRVRQAASA